MKYLESFKDIFILIPTSIIKLSNIILKFLKLNFSTDKNDDRKNIHGNEFSSENHTNIIYIFCLGFRIIGFYYDKTKKIVMIAFIYKNIELYRSKFDNNILDFFVSKIEKYAIDKRIKINGDQSLLYFNLKDTPLLIEELNNSELNDELELFSASNKYNL